MVLVLKSVKADMTAYGGFKWPENGPVEAPDWKPEPVCGCGLHGWLWGVGDYRLKVQAHDAKWLVIEVEEGSTVDLAGKVKFQKGNVVFCGSFIKARVRILAGRKEAGLTLEAMATGYSGHAAATGYSGHAAATGESGHAAATGDYGHAAATGYSGHAACLAPGGSAVCGKGGLIALTYRDEAKRCRLLVGYEGEGIEAGVKYVVRDGKFVPAE